MKFPLKLFPAFTLAVALVIAVATPALFAAPEKIKIRLAPMPGIGHLVPELAQGLGYFEQEGLDVHLVLPEKRKQMIAAAGAPVQQHTAVQSFLWHEGIEKGEFSVYHACEWGQMRRTQDTCAGAKVITKRREVEPVNYKLIAFGLLMEQIAALRSTGNLCPDWESGEHLVFDTFEITPDEIIALALEPELQSD